MDIVIVLGLHQPVSREDLVFHEEDISVVSSNFKELMIGLIWVSVDNY